MVEQPIQWTKNRYKTTVTADSRREEILPAELPQMIRRFHRQLPGYRMSPLKGLSNLVHKLASQGRIQAIEQSGARVVVVDGNYDDAVRQVDHDAQQNDWEAVSDTSWEGYDDIPKWVMQGYTTMFSEAQEQLVVNKTVLLLDNKNTQ